MSQQSQRSDSTELIEDLVKLLHEDRPGLPPLTIGEITKYLNSEQESVGQACRSTFNMNILDLIKSIRLEQVKKSYLNPHWDALAVQSHWPPRIPALGCAAASPGNRRIRGLGQDLWPTNGCRCQQSSALQG